jgi:hypothetical protein
LRALGITLVVAGSVLGAGALSVVERCGELIEPGTPWDLGHVDGDRTRYAGPEHRYCNRATATHKAKRSRRTSYAFVDEQRCKVSRQW